MLCDKTCEDCRYSTLLCDPADEHLFIACDYIGAIGHMRPCYAGNLCNVKVTTPTPLVGRDRETDRQRLYRKYVKATLQGRQSEAIREFMHREGYTIASLAERLHVYHNTVRRWVREYTFANWDDLAFLGLEKPEGMPTAETHPKPKTDTGDYNP